MAMKTIMDILKPENVEVRLTTIMTLGEWEQMIAELKPDDGRTLEHWHPAMQFHRLVEDNIRQIKKDVFGYGEQKPETE